MPRLFVALDLPEEIRASLDAACARIGDFAPDKVRVSTSSQLHVTLKFLGECPNWAIPGLIEVLSGTTRTFEAFEISIAGMNTFPERGPVRVVFAACEAPEITRMHADIESNLERLGWPREARVFTPHITLARAKTGVPRKFMEDLLKGVELPPLEGQISAVALYESRLDSSGAKYYPLHRFPLCSP